MVVLPRPPDVADPEMQVWLNRLVDAMQRGLDDLALAARVGIVVSNVTAPTTYDAAAATLADTRQALGTLLSALKMAGRIS